MRASRQLVVTLVLLGAAAAPAWWLTDAPAPVAACASVASALYAIGLARRESRRSTVSIALGGADSVAIDGRGIEAFSVRWRGGLVSLAWRADTRVQRRLAFPDALDSGARRELRLWALSRRERADAPAVAP